MPEAAPSAPLLSIVVPSFNQGRYLTDCIESVLTQDHRPIELIVVDGASRDETVEVLKRYSKHPELRWISEPDDGPASAVNKGLALARGEFASIQSADDYYMPGAFTRAMRDFAADPAVGLVYGEVQGVSAAGQPRRTSRRPPHDNALCIALCICIPQCSAFFRTSLARELGGWRKEFHTCDWDFWLRMMFRTRVRKVDEVLSAWRMYPGQRTDQRRAVYESFRRMLDESPEIAAADDDVKRAARAAKQLIGASFGDRRNRRSQILHILRATALYPRIWPWIPNKDRLVPGYQFGQRLRRWLARPSTPLQ